MTVGRGSPSPEVIIDKSSERNDRIAIVTEILEV